MSRSSVPEKIDVRAALRSAAQMVRESDIALVYGGMVIGVAVVLAFAPQSVHDKFVLNSSTNLANLRDHPLYVLAVSAFVVSSVFGLVLVPPLMIAYAAAQRWLGRLAAIIAGVFGHFGATLFVATLLVAGIRDRVVTAAVAREPDVGVSYGLAAVCGLLTAYVPVRWRRWYFGAAAIVLGVPLVASRTFTDVGHATAFVIGLGLARIAHRAARVASPGAPGAGQNASS